MTATTTKEPAPSQSRGIPLAALSEEPYHMAVIYPSREWVYYDGTHYIFNGYQGVQMTEEQAQEYLTNAHIEWIENATDFTI